jgi:serine/threonine-protein kinase
VRALQLAEQILDALDAAHSVDVIHRDLKPGNVLLAKQSGGSEVVKLLDFGLSKQTPQVLVAGEGEGEARSVVAGTPEYVAPEQARGQPACKQSDLYSFGVMLFEMLTGQLPFATGQERKNRTIWLLNMHANVPAPRITPLPGGNPFPQELENLVAVLLAKQPQDRPQSAAAVRAEVQRILQSLGRSATEGLPAPSSPGVERVDTVSIELMVPPARRALPWMLGAVGLAVVAVGALSLGEAEPPPVASGPAPGETVVTVRKVAPPVPVVPTPEAVPVAAPVPVAVEPSEDPMRALAPEVKPNKPRKAAASRNPLAEECEPSPRWRTSAQARLQEVQQLAAGAGDARAWAAFEKAEPGISEAISKAETPVQCGEVEQRIRTLARGMASGGRK